jgi:hypothetical protein
MLIFELTPLSAFEEPTMSETESPPLSALDITLSLDDLRHKALADAARPEILWSGRRSIVSEVSGSDCMRFVVPMGNVRVVALLPHL